MIPSETELLSAKILIVDDQPAHVLLLERLLLETGYVNVSSVLDAQNVCALHGANCYDLILSLIHICREPRVHQTDTPLGDYLENYSAGLPLDLGAGHTGGCRGRPGQCL